MSIVNYTKKNVESLFENVVILLGVLLVLVPTNPRFMVLSGRDSGVFLYTGWRILHGEIPYLHVWDHKPPVIHFLNALGLLVGGGSRWGVWLIEFVALWLAAFMGYKLIKKVFGGLSAIFSLYLWLFSLCFLIGGGNFTTEYTLPLQFACLWLAFDAAKHNFFSWRGFLIGLLCSLAFFTKQNTVGIGIAIVSYLIVNRSTHKQFKKLWLDLSIIFLGGFSFLLLVIIYFSYHGILPIFWDAVFVYNFAYSSLSFKSHIDPIINGIKSISYLAQFALVGWSGGLVLVIYNKNLGREIRSIITIGLINLPIELIFVSISGNNYAHYYMALLPIFSFFSGLAFWLLIKSLSQIYPYKGPQLIFTFCVLLILSLVFTSSYLDRVEVLGQNRERSVLSYTYIEKSTHESASVLLWGSEAEMNFYSGRKSPSRFVYQYPLYLPGYANEQLVKEFLLDIAQNKPALIIDTKNIRTPFLEFNINSTEIEEYLNYLRLHYIRKEKLGSWVVYEYVDKP
jgi:4-amino-4-deoxy-L-arabinose transferase-like glycosyltransferase